MSQVWSHNAYYHRVVLGAVPPGCGRALDVGCGQGELTRRLRVVVPQVVGLDRDQRGISVAAAHPDVCYVLGDFLAGPGPLRPGSFDFVTSVAVLHHGDGEAGLRRMAELLRPGGVLVVVGLARDSLPLSLIWDIPAVIGHRLHVAAASVRGPRPPDSGDESPVVWPPPLSYRQMRQLAREVLPGSCFRRRLYWRYTLVWTKPH